MQLFPMADDLLVQAATEFVEKQVSRLSGVVEDIRIQKLYAEIAGMAGESMLENLNTKIRQRFMIAPMALVFAQGMNDDLLYRLISRDDETSKQMFQLLLDSIPSNKGVLAMSNALKRMHSIQSALPTVNHIYKVCLLMERLFCSIWQSVAA